MKRALIDSATLRVVQVEDQDFATHAGLYWVDCPDDTGTYYLYDPEELTFEDPHAHTKDEFGNPTEPFTMQRMRAYPPSGDQLDMLYKEIAATGTISKTGTWFKSIAAVKAGIPKPIDPSVIINHLDTDGGLADFYENVPGSRTSGSGKDATFKFRKSNLGLQVAITTVGSKYAMNDTITIPGSDVEEAADLLLVVKGIIGDGGLAKVVIA